MERLTGNGPKRNISIVIAVGLAIYFVIQHFGTGNSIPESVLISTISLRHQLALTAPSFTRHHPIANMHTEKRLGEGRMARTAGLEIPFRNFSKETNYLDANQFFLFGERRRQLLQACEDLHVTESKVNSQQRILVNADYGVSMCHVPKAGCTFWKRVFISLKYKHLNISRVSKVRTHTIHLTSLTSFDSFDEAYGFLSKSARLIFVRDPYTRLYSGYTDKLFLSEFWHTRGRAIVKQIRPNAGNHSLSCGHDVTFEEFLKYVVSRCLLKSPRDMFGENVHWVPITTLCHPCTFDYHLIGKQETFSSDRDFIFRFFGFPRHSLPFFSPDDIVKDGIEQAIDISWNNIRDCVPRQEIARRMWQAYKGQGYIHSSVPFPEDKISNLTKREEFLSIAISAYQSRIPTKKETQRQRLDAVVAAYRTVSVDVLREIQQAFQEDFQLFGYSPTPDYLRDIFLKTSPG